MHICFSGLATGVEKDRNNCLNETEPIYKVGYKAADYSMMEKAKLYFGMLRGEGHTHSDTEHHGVV
jgi:hypothetical protein